MERNGTEIPCPYRDCTFRGTEDEVQDHVEYCKSFEDPDHDESKRQ